MIVADGTAGRQPHPDRRRGLGAITGVENEVFLRDRAPLAGRDIAAVEAAGDPIVENLLGRRGLAVVGHQIAGQLQDRELVERHVAVECIHHPLPVGPDLAVVVDVDAVGVAVPGIVEPVAAAVLAPLEARKHRVDEPVVGIGVRIGNEGIYDRRLRRQAGEIEREPTGQHAAIGLGRGREAFRFESCEEESIDRVLDPRLVFHRRWLRPRGWNKRPVRLVLRPLSNPPLEQFLMLRRQRLLRGRGRHYLFGIVGKNPVEHDARIDVPWDDRPRLHGVVPHVETQIGLAAGAVCPVAGEAVLHQDRADVLIKREAIGRHATDGNRQRYDAC